MFQVAEHNGNWYVKAGKKIESYQDKNALIKAIASLISVSILTSDEVNIIKGGNNNLSVAMDQKTKSSLESTEWDTETVTHDGIQFNKHFIELKQKVMSLEAANVKLLERLNAVEDSKELAINAIDGFVCDENLNSIPPMYRRLLIFAKIISDAMKK